MKTRFIFSTMLLIAFLMSSCVSQLPAQVKRENRNVGTFTKISLAVPANVSLLQSSEQKFSIEASEKTLENIETYVSGSELIIKFKSNWSFNNSGEIKIAINIPTLEGISIAGSGDVTSRADFKCDNLKLEIAGSGDVIFSKLTANSLDMEIAGSGKINLTGNSRTSKIEIAGSGDVYTKDMECEDVNIEIAGSGNAEVFAKNNLKVEIAGSGDVKYKGSPQIDTESHGSGNIQKM